MKKTLVQKTLYEIHQKRLSAGYKLVEADDVFVILWNTPELSYFSKAHCEALTEKNYAFLKQKFPTGTLDIASSKKSTLEGQHPDLIYEGTSDIMMLEPKTLLKENNKFKIKLVETKEDCRIFAQIADEVFNHKYAAKDLEKSFIASLGLKHCHKYLGYDGKNPVGIIDVSEGKDAVYLCWGAVKKDHRRKGLFSAMMAYTINIEIKKNFHKFLLIPSEDGRKLYASLGFKVIDTRYNYTLKNE